MVWIFIQEHVEVAIIILMWQDYVDVDRVLLKSRAEIKIDPNLLIHQPMSNDVAKVRSSVAICLH